MIRWPDIDDSYREEFGEIDLEVYLKAGELWPRAERYAISLLGDAPAGLRLMLRAVAIASRKVRHSLPVVNVQAYLFQVYKRLIIAEVEKERRRTELIRKHYVLPQDTNHDDPSNKVLIAQIVSRMNPQMRQIYTFLILGYTYEEIVYKMNPNLENATKAEISRRAHALRNAFSRELMRLQRMLKNGE